MPGGDRSTKRPRRSRRMKAARLVGVASRPPNPDHDLVAGDKRSDQISTARTPLLSDRKRRRQDGGAGMRPGTRACQRVELESVGERPVGEGGGARLDRRTIAAE